MVRSILATNENFTLALWKLRLTRITPTLPKQTIRTIATTQQLRTTLLTPSLLTATILTRRTIHHRRARSANALSATAGSPTWPPTSLRIWPTTRAHTLVRCAIGGLLAPMIFSATPNRTAVMPLSAAHYLCGAHSPTMPLVTLSPAATKTVGFPAVILIKTISRPCTLNTPRAPKRSSAMV